ncbi:MAG: tetratricopeptide repeat protein [Rhizobiales bacterium]|nr:tetratricopeptide repeat protein [Hyphomicrobiales bacterium]
MIRHLTRSLLLSAALACSLSWADTSIAATPYQTSLSGNYLASRTAGRNRDTVEAAAFLVAALKQDPKNPVLTERLFQLQLANGNTADAEKLADKVLTFNSQQRMARLVLGLRDFRQKKFEAARKNFAEAAYTPVGELTSALLTAWTYAGEGSFQAAMKALDKLDRNDTFANFKSLHSALIADYLNNTLRAEPSYRKAYADAGTSLRVTQAYGNYLLRTGKKAEAEKVYTAFLAGGDSNVMVAKALENAKAGKVPDPFIASASAGAAEAMFSLAAAMNDDQSIDVALVYAQLALSLDSDRPVLLTLLGDILASSQRYQQAIDVFEQVPVTSELRTNADTEIAINLQRLNRDTDAETRMRAILGREPKNIDTWTTLGNLLRSNEKYADAVKAYDQAIDLLKAENRDVWTVHYYRGIALERLKKWDKAEADFRTALALSPNEPSVLNYLGYSLIDMNMKLDEAIGMVKKAVELRPNDGYIVDSLGWAYYQMRDYDEAVTHLERAVDLKPGDPIISEHLGDAYWRVGRRLEARFQWQHAKDNGPQPDDLKRIEGKLRDGLPAEAPPVKPADNSPQQPSNG